LKKKKDVFHLKIQSDTKNLAIIRNFVFNAALKAGFDNESANKIELSVDEACSNVIRHSYKLKSDHYLDITISIDQKKFVITISDKGKGFDPQGIKEPDMEEYISKLKVGGLGIYMMRTLMDEVEYDIRPGDKNRVKMVKYFEN